MRSSESCEILYAVGGSDGFSVGANFGTFSGKRILMFSGAVLLYTLRSTSRGFAFSHSQIVFWSWSNDQLRHGSGVRMINDNMTIESSKQICTNQGGTHHTQNMVCRSAIGLELSVRTKYGRWHKNSCEPRTCQSRFLKYRFPFSEHIELSLEHLSMCLEHVFLDCGHKLLEQLDRSLMSYDCLIEFPVILQDETVYNDGVYLRHAFCYGGTHCEKGSDGIP